MAESFSMMISRVDSPEAPSLERLIYQNAMSFYADEAATSTTGRDHVWSPHRFLNSDGLVKRKELVGAVFRNG